MVGGADLGQLRSIERDITRSRKLGPDLDRVAGTSLDKGAELDALAALSPESRAPIIERNTARTAMSGEVKDIRREATALKELVADLTLENRLLKKV